MRALQRLKSVDFFRKIPTCGHAGAIAPLLAIIAPLQTTLHRDLTEATLSGATISLIAALMMAFLLGMVCAIGTHHQQANNPCPPTQELSAFMSLDTRSELVVDRSTQGELLRINFNISFPALSCEFAVLDVSDSLGTKKLNLTKTVRKLPINEDLERAGRYMFQDDTQHRTGPKYDDALPVQVPVEDWSLPLTHENFKDTLSKYDIAVINFFAPWCPWCQRFEPTWEAATKDVHERYPETDGRIRFGKIDCTLEVDLCREQQIMGFPSVRVYRKGSDDVMVHGHHEHESYRGDRTLEALSKFADSLIPSAGLPHYYIPGLTKVAKSAGCNLSGFVLCKKVPGSMHFLAKAPGHSFDHMTMNMSHLVHHLYFGTKPTPRRQRALEALHPLGLTDDWADKLRGTQYISTTGRATFEHYMQVVLTTIVPRGSAANRYDAYEYTVHSHTFDTESIPEAKFTYDTSPVQIVVTEKRKALYHFITTTCAIVGGVFTVAGIVDALLHQSLRIAKKMEIGKHS